jgi:hypothetical protein
MTSDDGDSSELSKIFAAIRLGGRFFHFFRLKANGEKPEAAFKVRGWYRETVENVNT